MTQRLDKLICSQGAYTRKQAQQLIKDGLVKVEMDEQRTMLIKLL